MSCWPVWVGQRFATPAALLSPGHDSARPRGTLPSLSPYETLLGKAKPPDRVWATSSSTEGKKTGSRPLPQTECPNGLARAHPSRLWLVLFFQEACPDYSAYVHFSCLISQYGSPGLVQRLFPCLWQVWGHLRVSKGPGQSLKMMMMVAVVVVAVTIIE